ncbi:ATP-binding protein [Pseudomonas agarici]|uniref:ATP-binding protein n=1 Tax=Pseudomonas agarici TaxID=46677 RepID=UPI0015A4D516|nr:ATP-binding protein [Pseudomonas agarici]
MANFIDATYATSGLSQYDGNPLIEALPPIHDDETVGELLCSFPAFPSPAELALGPKLRAHCVNRISDIVVPMDLHLQFEASFSQLIRGGYTARNPFSRDAVAMLHAVDDVQLRYSGFKSSASTLAIFGLSGMGKTTMLNSVVKTYPQVIVHKKYAGNKFRSTQVVWLKIECPHDGSPRGLCSSFFTALDIALGTDYTDRYMKPRASVSMLMQHVSQLSRSFNVGVLIIDELQNLNLLSDSDSRQRILNFFLTLSNDAGVPLIYSGTNSTFKLFSKVVRNARRALGMGDYYFDRFKIDEDEWKALVQTFLAYNWTEENIELTAELNSKLYELTQGNTDFLAKLMMLTQWYALSNEKKITPALYQKVYDQQMIILHRPIEALRSRDPLQIADFEDMMPAREQVAQMMDVARSRRAHRSGLALLHRKGLSGSLDQTTEAGTAKAVRRLAAVADPSVRSDAQDIAESDDWEKVAQEKGFTNLNDDVELW